MTKRSVAHGMFTIERTYPGVTPRRVFDAFATEKGKAAWFAGPNARWVMVEREFDFRIGGRERLSGRWESGMITTFDATFFDIVPGERIIYAYEMQIDGRKISTSLATFEFKAAPGGGTAFRMTEQGAFLDGYDDNGSRERGSIEIVDKLSAYLEG
ncbi:MAG: SRPBCC family protein [Proteobacteria bacterium]|nr:SRPBCC family protein [Pseudomonadota bacterium]